VLGGGVLGGLSGRVLGASVDAFSVGSVDAFSVGTAHANKGKLPVEAVSLARRSTRLEGARRQYMAVERLPSISDSEDGVEFCWREEA
jgi:hypothetical protein